MTQQKLNYIHYYLLAIITSILVWGGFEYISICNGQNCMIDTPRLWKGVGLIALIFIPITLCVWSEYVNGQLQKIFGSIKLLYEEKTLIFAIAIFISLSIASLMIFNAWWTYFVKENASKEYMAALVNLSVFVATLFAPIAALILYDNWKIQHNKTVLSNEAKELWHKFKSLEKKTYSLDEIYLRSGQIQELVYFKSVPDLDKSTSDLIKEYDKSYSELNYFTELAQDENNNVHQNYYGAIKAYREYIQTIVVNTTIGEIHEIEEELRNNLITENRNIRNYLSDFILIK